MSIKMIPGMSGNVQVELWSEEDEQAITLMSTKLWRTMRISERKRCLEYVMRTAHNDAKAAKWLKDDLGVRVELAEKIGRQHIRDPEREFVVRGRFMVIREI